MRKSDRETEGKREVENKWVMKVARECKRESEGGKEI